MIKKITNQMSQVVKNIRKNYIASNEIESSIKMVA